MNNKTFKRVVLVFGAVFIFSNCSFGQSQDRKDRRKRPTFKELLKEMDTNEDGKLSEKEVKGPLKENFAKVDTDEDGFISAKEFAKAPKPKREPKR